MLLGWFHNIFIIHSKLIVIGYILSSALFCQSFFLPNKLPINQNNLAYKFNIFNSSGNNLYHSFLDTSFFNISMQTQFIFNSSHPNLDNYAEIYVPGFSTKLISARLEYSSSWLSLELEPYTIYHQGSFNKSPAFGTYRATNNHYFDNYPRKTMIGLRQSSLVLHYNGIGIGYGNMSHWWGPGFHSALALSSNAPSQPTYAFGTFKDKRIGQFSFGSQMIVMPYESMAKTQLYFSGLKAHISHHSKSVIFTLGFHRTYLSGNFENLSLTTNSIKNWTLLDAARLVFEPLFGQSKKNLDYVQPGTPGFDVWDELLTSFVKISFPNSGLEVYADVASDDNRGNLTDLKAHWDHTLGYQLGLIKHTKFNQYNIFTGIEYLTTRISNTFNPKFYRGGEPPNYYAKPIYDYFTFQGRRMGAHSGSSSDDLIFMLGFSDKVSMSLMSFNKERHGIKNMTHPELKTEYVLSYHRKIFQNHTAFITLEHEHIKNFGFIQNNISVSKLIWIGYSYSIR